MSLIQHNMSDIFLDSPYPIIIEDVNGIILDMNNEAENFLLWSREDLEGKHCTVIFPEIYHLKINELQSCCISRVDQSRVRNVELRMLSKDGVTLPVVLTLVGLQDTDGDIGAIAIFINDLSLQKTAELRVKLYQKVFMDVTDPIFIEDVNGIVKLMNKEAELVYGWSSDELIGKSGKIIVPKEYHCQVDALLGRCRAGENIRSVRGMRQNKEGILLPVLLTLTLLKDDDGTVLGIATIAKDISKLVTAEKELHLLSKVFMEATDPILVEDVNGIVVNMNNEAEMVYGWCKEELIGQPIKTIVPKNLHGQADDLLFRCKKGEDVRNVQGMRCTKGGRKIPVLLTLSLLKNKKGEIVGIVTLAKDITKLKETEARLILTQDVTIESMGTLAEYRDSETGGHIKRTRFYVKLLATHLKNHPSLSQHLDEEFIESLYRSAPLHDIGKVGVRDSILLKAGKYTEDEYNEMKKHTIYGEEIIASLVKMLGPHSFLHLAQEMAAYHHEKWDGTGYPYGLKGSAIPVSARLMAVADVYDAIISKRCYKEPISHVKAVKIMKDLRGTSFEPLIIDGFLEIEDEFRQIALCFADCDEERELLQPSVDV